MLSALVFLAGLCGCYPLVNTLCCQWHRIIVGLPSARFRSPPQGCSSTACQRQIRPCHDIAGAFRVLLCQFLFPRSVVLGSRAFLSKWSSSSARGHRRIALTNFRGPKQQRTSHGGRPILLQSPSPTSESVFICLLVFMTKLLFADRWPWQKTGKAEAPTAAQMQKVVDVVNETIAKDQACFRLTMPRKDAEGTYGSAM